MGALIRRAFARHLLRNCQRAGDSAPSRDCAELSFAKSESNKKDIPIVLIQDLPEKSPAEMFPSSGANAWMRNPLTRDKCST